VAAKNDSEFHIYKTDIRASVLSILSYSVTVPANSTPVTIGGVWCQTW